MRAKKKKKPFIYWHQNQPDKIYTGDPFIDANMFERNKSERWEEKRQFHYNLRPSFATPIFF